jgi:hypothetical protein
VSPNGCRERLEGCSVLEFRAPALEIAPSCKAIVWPTTKWASLTKRFSGAELALLAPAAERWRSAPGE